MQEKDRFSIPVLLPTIFLVVSLFVAILPAVSALQNRTDISGIDLDNASLDVHVLVERGGYVVAVASFHGEKGVQAAPAPFARIPLRSGEVEVQAEQTGENQVKVSADARLALVKNKLGPRFEMGLAYLSNLTVEEINERFSPKVEGLYSRLQKAVQAWVQKKAQDVPENTELPKLESFRITSFSWDSPELKASVEAKFAHPDVEKLDLPIALDASVSVRRGSIEADAGLSATPKGPGLENTSFSLSVSKRDNLGILDASATARGKLPKKDNAYVMDFSRYTKNISRKKLSRLENLELPGNLSVTAELEVSKPLRVENQPSAPSYCKYCGTDKPRIYVWENEDAVAAATSLLSGKSTFSVASVPKEKPRAGTPYAYLIVAAVAIALAAGGVAYWRKRGASEE